MLPEAEPVELSVSQFVAVFNQAIDFAFPSVTVVGELANLRVSKNRWVYFDLKDEGATVKFFGTVYQLPGPLEDGLLLKVRGQPRLHNLYGFSVNVLSMQPAGEGSIRRAADLLRAKLEAEGLFDESRKRLLPYPPARIGLVTSKQSAAYADFVKILDARWHGLEIELIDVQVQGEAAPGQIVAALERFNAQAGLPDVLVLIRGGGSPEDLAAFSTEPVVRAVAASRAPTLVAIGHEIDLSLAELAADVRASTPSNAAELLVPDRGEVLRSLKDARGQLGQHAAQQIQAAGLELKQTAARFEQFLEQLLKQAQVEAAGYRQLLAALDPGAILKRGYAIVRTNGQAVSAINQLHAGDAVDVQLADGGFAASVNKVLKGNKHG